MIRIFLIILSLFMPIITSAASDGGEVGGAYKMGFYSRINDNIDAVSDALRKKDLSKFSTFKGFGSLCREPMNWIDSEPMDENILREAQYGAYSRLMNLATKKKVQLDTESLTSIANCFAETYKNLGDIALDREKSLTTAGGMGLYTDGNTSNSDYDIVADIEKIDGILFSEKLDYKGTANMTPDSWKNYLKGANPLGLFHNTSTPSPTTLATTDPDSVNSISPSQTEGDPTLIGSQSQGPTLSSLGISNTCNSGDATSGVSNLFSDDFLASLDTTLQTGQDTGWSNYSTRDNTLYNNTNSTQAPPLSTNSAALLAMKPDFFHTPPCNEFFCITFSITTGNQNLLGGGRTYSIESLFDKHDKIMGPIANSNLAAQKYQTNDFQLASYFQLSNVVSGGGVFIEDSPQKTEKRKTEDTPAEQEKQFEDFRKCAYTSAGLSSDKNQANIPLGAGYDTALANQTSDTIGSTTKILGPQNPEDTSFGSACTTIIQGQAREKYYTSLSTDLTELQVFSAAFIDQIAKAINIDLKLDKLPTQ